MQERITVDFQALDRIASRLRTAGGDLEEAARMLSRLSLSVENGAYARANVGISLKSIGGRVSASSVSGAVSSYRNALNRLGLHSRALATSVNTAARSFREAENGMSGKHEIVFTVDGESVVIDGTVFPKIVWERYLLQIIGGGATYTIFSRTNSNEWSLTAGNDFSKLNDGIKDRLDKWGLRDKKTYKDGYYDPESGKWIDEKKAPLFYEREATIFEVGDKASVEADLFKASYDWGKGGKMDVAVGKAEAHAEWGAGLYVVSTDKNGNTIRKFSPGVHGEVGASITALEVNYENQLLGDENLGFNVEGGVTVGKVGAKAEGGFQIYGEDGKLKPQIGVSASAEAIGGEISGKAGVNVLGGEVGVKGSLNYGIGAHADVGYKDGVFKVDIGATLGVGASVSLEVDIGGMVNTVADAAASAWDGIKSGWDSFWSGW